jgi:uncharacterized membrane protein YkvA (DUF1232 family)
MAMFRFLTVTRLALPRVIPLLRHGRVPFWLKAGVVIAALLIVSPLDLFGDIPILGFLDDAVLLALLLNGFVALAARYAFAGGFATAEPPMRRAAPVVYRLRP